MDYILSLFKQLDSNSEDFRYLNKKFTKHKVLQ